MSPPPHDDPPTPVRTTDEQRREDAREYVQRLRVFYTHAAVAAASLVLIFAVNLAVNIGANLTGEWWAWWSGWAVIGWGLGLTIHGLVVRLSRPQSLRSGWEERQIDKILSEGGSEPPR